MKMLLTARRFTLLALIAAFVSAAFGRLTAQTTTDAVEVLRSSIRADRKVVITEVMQFTEKESQAFWPVYQQYRADADKLNDSVIKLLLEYMDLYPDVPEQRALSMLKDYAAFEEKQASLKKKYIGKFTKVLPAAKVIRYFQLENRLDLVIRVQLASFIPMTTPPGAETKPN